MKFGFLDEHRAVWPVGALCAAEAYRSALARSGVTPSMSRKGDCRDNVPMEGFYNPRRLQSALGHISPAEAERRAA